MDFEEANSQVDSLCGALPRDDLRMHILARPDDTSSRGRLDLAVLFTPSTPNRQNRNQVRLNICAGVRRSTPSYEVV